MMANFDVIGAKKAGYSDAEIADHLSEASKFDSASARKEGYSDQEIIKHLNPVSKFDVLKGGASGLISGIAGIAGQGGDLERQIRGAVLNSGMTLGNAGANLLGRPGITPQAMQNIQAVSNKAPTIMPSSQPVMQDTQRMLGSPQTKGGKYAQTIASMAPAAFGGGGGLVTRAARVIVPGVASEAAGQMTQGKPYEQAARIAGALAGGPISQFATGMGRKIASPITNQLSTEENRIAEIAKKEGINLTPGQQTGSRPLQAVESTLTQLPFSSAPQRATYETQRKQFNKAVLKRAGVDADTAAPEVISSGFINLGKKFDDLINKTPELKITPEFGKKIQEVSNEYGRRLETNVAPVFNSYVDDINKAIKAASKKGQNVYIDSKTYKNISSDLRTAARNNSKDPSLKNALLGLKETFDDLLESNVGKNIANEWKSVRNNYRNLLVIDDAMKGGTKADVIAANIPFGSFKQSVQNSDKAGWSRGRGDLNDLARVGGFLSSKIPDSGTAERTMYQKILANPVTTIGGGAVGVATGVLPLKIAAALAIPPAVQKAINSKAGKAYLTNQRFTGPNPVKNTRQQAALAAFLAAKQGQTQ